jgi:tetratricopeptide (TPR) repeat protein
MNEASDRMIEAAGHNSIAAHSIGIAVTGNDARIVSLPEGVMNWAKEVSVPPGSGSLPRPASPTFTGRDAELAELREMLISGGEAAVTQQGSRAVHGLGGIGKSALVLQYAHRFRDEYSVVWWIAAETRDHIQAGLAALAQYLCPQWAMSADLNARAAWAILWLQWHSGWLLVFDNVEDPNDLLPYWGTLTQGHRLATSRKATGWQSISPVMPLGLLDLDASTHLLCTLAFNGKPPSSDQLDQARGLATDLGHLPLALEQAGAYLHQTGSDIAAYRKELGLLLDDASDGIDHERTIARIWNHTFKVIARQNPLAVTLLHAMAWFAPDAIPRPLLAPLAPDLRTLNKSLGVLHAYSMVKFGGTGELTVHRLVQAVLRASSFERDDFPKMIRVAEDLISQNLYVDGEDGESVAAPPDRWENLIPHVLALAANTPASYSSDQLCDLYEPVVEFMQEQSQIARALPLFQVMLSQREKTLGVAHVETIGGRINLAAAYQEAGNLGEAIPLFMAALAQCEEALGADDPRTLIASNNLGQAYEAAGDLGRAISLHKATLGKRTKILGETHLQTLTSLNNLAYIYEVSGDLGRAVPLYRESLAKHERVLGDTHPQTLHSRFNLARACMEAGDVIEALSLHKTTLAQREEVLGDTHPKTLDSRNDLARTYQAVGELETAISLHEAVFAQREEVLGNAHPETLQSGNNLAFAYQENGDFERAIQVCSATLTVSERALGDMHPFTLKLRHNLAFMYQQAGDLAQVIPLQELVLAQREQVLSDGHPDILFSRHNLAGAHREVGNTRLAISLYETNLARCEEILGRSHNLTLQSRLGLARAYEELGEFREAIPLLEAALGDSKESFGEDHPRTVVALNELATACYASRDLPRAIRLFTETLVQCKRILGPNHLQTLQGSNNLAVAYSASGDLQRSISMLEETLLQCKRVLGENHPQTLQCGRNLASAYRDARAAGQK